MTNDKTSLQDQIDEATFDFTVGDSAAAIDKLATLSKIHPNSFEVWHALAEIYFSEDRIDDSLAAAEKAHAIRPDDIHINTSLSRIWVERGDKNKAEHFGAQARMLGWKDELKNSERPTSKSE